MTNALLLRVPEAARLLGVSPRTMYTLIKQGDLRAVLVGTGGGVLRVERAEVERYIESRREA